MCFYYFIRFLSSVKTQHHFQFTQDVVKTGDASIPKAARRGRKRKVTVWLIIYV